MHGVTTQLALVAAVAFSAVSPAWSTPGDQDASFDGDGTVIMPAAFPQKSAMSVAVQADGKLLIAGYGHNGTDYDFALSRYNVDGTLDSSFGSDGTVLTQMGTFNNYGYAVAVQSDGKVLVAGVGVNGSPNDFALVRYNIDGSLDASFGESGVVMTPMGESSDGATAIAVQPDGKVLVAGYSFNGADNDFALARYNGDGSLDTGFSGDGKVITSIGSYSEQAESVVVQPDGKVLVAGHTSKGTDEDIALMRYYADGSLDTGFDGDGILVAPIGTRDDFGQAVAVQPDGKLLVAGYSINSSDFYDTVLARFNADGSPDTTFGTGGKVITDLNPGSDAAYSLAIQPDGKVLVAGYAGGAGDRDFALVRYDGDGTPDATFSGDGVVITAVTASADQGNSVALQPDGKAVVVGTADNLVGLARYIAADTPWDLTPTAVVFSGESGVAMGSIRTSNEITVAGLEAGVKVPLHISGGNYSLNGGAYTSNWGWVENDDVIVVRHTAASSPETATNTAVTIGGLIAANNPSLILGDTVSIVFTSVTADTTPDAFTFVDVFDVARNAAVDSAAVTITGINVATSVTVINGEYSVGCTGSFTSEAGNIANGETVCVRHTASASYGATVNTTLTVGGVSDVFSSTTDFSLLLLLTIPGVLRCRSRVARGDNESRKPSRTRLSPNAKFARNGESPRRMM